MQPFRMENGAGIGYYQPFNYNQRSSHLQGSKEKYTIKVIGKSVLTVKSDQAMVLFGIVTDSMKVENAQQQNTVLSNQVLAALHNIGLKEKIETVTYTIEQVFDTKNGKQDFTGYKVKHMMKVTVKDLFQLGKIIDVVTQNGANVINDIKFEVSNPDFYYQEALKQASINARKKAETMANAVGVTINKIPIWMKEESVEIIRPLYKASMLVAAPGATTPIQEGTVEVTAYVQALFKYE